MAVLTPLTEADVDRIAGAHALGSVSAVTPVPEGSVNTNYFFDTSSRGRVFVRVYEEQGPDGAGYEWRLLDRLTGAGIPAPQRISGPPPGAVLVAGKPVAVFEVVSGVESCQRLVTEARAAAMGTMLARCHGALDSVSERRGGRFTWAHVEERLRVAERSPKGVELAADIARTRAALADVSEAAMTGVDRGVIHGDLFRDNVRWDGDSVSAIIDWESASDGVRIYDLMVTTLAWCFGDSLDVTLARAMVSAYARTRPLGDADKAALHLCARAVCVRFTATRMTDYFLRRGMVAMQYRDYRRFLARLDEVESHAPAEFARLLLGA